jgi:hypothetical protein
MRSSASPGRRLPSPTRDAPIVSFAREGLPLIVIAALVAAGTYALALNRRSWPLWLLAFALTIAALWVAYFFSDPRDRAPRGARTTTADVRDDVPVRPAFATYAPSSDLARSTSFAMSQLNVSVDRFRVSAR